MHQLWVCKQRFKCSCSVVPDSPSPVPSAAFLGTPGCRAAAGRDRAGAPSASVAQGWDSATGPDARAGVTCGVSCTMAQGAWPCAGLTVPPHFLLKVLGLWDHSVGLSISLWWWERVPGSRCWPGPWPS